MLQAVPGIALQGIPDIQNATIITSQYGVIVKSGAEGKVWLFANNDAASLQKFEAIKQQLQSSYVSETVYGVTIVKS